MVCVCGGGGGGGRVLLLDSLVSQKSGKVPLPQPVWEPPLLCSILTTWEKHASPSRPVPNGRAGELAYLSSPHPLGEEAACQADTACQILLLPNCETAAFKETLFWPPATPQTAWYNFIIKEREKKGGGWEREKKGERGGNCLVQVSWLSILLNVKAGMAFQLAS